MTGGGHFLRKNILLVAAVSLPLAVVGLFLLASAIPRWLVPPPAYDLLMRVEGYDPARPRVAVDIAVRGGMVEATVRGLPANSYPQVPTLLLYEHQTLNVREIPLDVPSGLTETDPPVTVAIPALAGRRVVAQAKAPDGYELRTRNRQRSLWRAVRDERRERPRVAREQGAGRADFAAIQPVRVLGVRCWLGRQRRSALTWTSVTARCRT